MVTARQMLKARARQALVIGDDVLTAAGAADLAHARASLPGLAAGLRQDGAPAGAVAAVIGGVVRDITGRAASLVEASLFADGWGAPPSPYAVLVLGSAGRGESLLAFDQDNALVFLGDQALDPWFAEFGVRLNAMLDQAGILFCPGEVMVRSRQWRRSLDDWQSTLRHWVFQPDMQALLNVDIFFDMAFVHGDQALAIELRDYAFATAAQSAFFLQLLTHAVARLDSPLGAFGRLITQEGRFDAKKYGLLPLVSTARARGLGAHVTATGTIDRYRGLVEKGVMHADDMAGLAAAFEDILSAILAQQLADIAAGLPPGNKVAPEALPRAERDRLRSAFQRIKLLRAAAGTIMPAA
jgi:signal-transduction protein with cAMP-binding, CBS, and nucleotidyltransferase domain